jgi:hypothetical protein
MLVPAEITTKEGDVYVFPCMLQSEAQQWIDNASSFSYQTQLTLVNVSGACLVLPTRVIATISIGGVEVWKSNSNA